jgi:uncharacterized RDD family membrane protein YckC
MSLNQVQVTTPEQVSLNYKIAGLGSRATAQILDWLILILVNFALFFCFGVLTKVLPVSFAETVNSYLNAIVLITLFFLLWGYFLLFEYFATGRTPGKMLVGIRVIQDNGQSLTFLTSAVRNLVRIIDFLPAFYLLGILMIFFHSQHKRIGDLAAGTIVVYQRKTKRKKKKNRLEKAIEKRLTANPVLLELDEWTIKKFGSREWKLIETFIKRRPSLAAKEQNDMTLQVAAILFPMLGMKPANQPLREVENTLFALYILLKEEWQYEAE